MNPDNNSREAVYLKEKFKEFYLKNKIESPPEIEKREFGIGSFHKKITLRHLGFVSGKTLNNFLSTRAPLYISYSIAYYEFPERKPMANKHLLGADLIYEFDADDLETDCKEEHDFWSCPNCKKSGKGNRKLCPFCGAHVLTEEWYCSKCLRETKKQTLRLLDFLFSDFGFKENDIKINFSGNAGYHVHIRSSAIRNLSKEARIQLIDYLTLTNFDLKIHGFLEFEDKFYRVPLIENLKGLPKRVLFNAKEIINHIEAESLALHTNISLRKAKEFLDRKNNVIEGLDKGFLINLFSVKQKNHDFWNAFFEFVSGKVMLPIDRQTSVDMHKIIRLPDSLHGSTGLQAKTINLNELKDFKPFNDAIVFNDNLVKVFIGKTPKFSLMNENFKAFNEEERELPEFAAIYLIGRQKAVLV